MGPDGSEIDTAAILTTEAKGPVAAVHDRMPVLVQPEDFARWLDCRTLEPRDVAPLMAGSADDYDTPLPVSNAVNKVANSGASLIDPVAEHPDAPAAPPAQSPVTKAAKPAKSETAGTPQLKLL
jgi:putative SOS response-associated peptidase YedK